MKVRVESDEVWYGDGPAVGVSAEELRALKAQALRNPRRRARLCAHASLEDPLHEMLIVHTRDTYVRPHRHLGRVESFHVIEGIADVAVFDEHGGVIAATRIGAMATGLPFYYRAADPAFHTLLIRSPLFVFHETTQGPLRKTGTLFAAWAPAGDGGVEVEAYLRRLTHAVDALLEGRIEPRGARRGRRQAVHGTRA